MAAIGMSVGDASLPAMRSLHLDRTSNQSADIEYDEDVSIPWFDDRMKLQICQVALASPSARPLQVTYEYPSLEEVQDENKKAQLRTLVHKYKEIFRLQLHPEGALVPPVRIELKSGAKLVKAYMPRLSAKLQSVVREQIADMLAQRVISPCNTGFTSPLLVIPKPGRRSWRIVIDFKILNANIKQKTWPLPRPLDLIKKLAGKAWYCVADLKSAYWQIKLHPDCRHLTAFNSMDKQYSYESLPMGLATAPSAFQEALTMALGDLIDTVCLLFVDDLIIFGDDWDSYVQNVSRVFARLQEKRFILRADKTKFALQEIVYLGYKVNARGYQPTEKYIQGLLDLPVPTSTKGLRSFMGLVNFVRSWLRNIAEIAQPLNQLCSSKQAFVWGAEQQAAFDKIKQCIRESKMLYHVDYSLPLYMNTDSSATAYGGYIWQKGPDGRKRPLGFTSKCFQGSACNWPIQEKELYAILHCLEYFKHIIAGQKLILYTDNRNLLHLKRSSTSPRLQRWSLMLDEHDLEIIHTSSKNNEVADAISRTFLCLREPTTVCQLGSTPPIVSSEQMVSRIEPFHGTAIGHHGVNRTVELIKRYGTPWPGMTAHVKQFINSCGVCQKFRLPVGNLATPLSTLAVGKLFQRFDMDSHGPYPKDEHGNKYILQIQCAFSRYTELFPLPRLTAKATADCIIKIAARYGIPEEFRSDNATQFCNAIVRRVIDSMGSKLTTSIAYTSRTAGGVERQIQSTSSMLRCIVADARVQEQWSECLPLVQRTINAMPHSATGCEPTRLVYADRVDLMRGLFPRREEEANATTQCSSKVTPETVVDYVQHQHDMQSVILEAARLHQEQVVQARLLKINGSATQRTLKPGDAVLCPFGKGHPPNKLARLQGPLLVTRRLGSNTYECLNPSTGAISKHSISKLKYFDASRTPDLRRLESIDRDEYIIEEIVSHRLSPEVAESGADSSNRKSDWEFYVKWYSYGEEENTWEPYGSIADAEALDIYLEDKPGLAKILG